MRWTDMDFIEVVQRSRSLSDICIHYYGNTYGGNLRTVNNHIRRLGLDISHYSGKPSLDRLRSVLFKERISVSDFFDGNTSIAASSLTRFLFRHRELLPYSCDVCGNEGVHLGKKLKLQLDHRNGRRHDWRIRNIRWLCPNCHSQTDTFGVGESGVKRKQGKKAFVQVMKRFDRKDVAELLGSGLKPIDIAKKLGVTYAAITKVIRSSNKPK